MNLSHDTEAWHYVHSRLLDPLLETALPNDPDLLVEIQCFWNEPPSIQVLSNLTPTAWEVSELGIAVISWLKVCSIPVDPQDSLIFPIHRFLLGM